MEPPTRAKRDLAFAAFSAWLVSERGLSIESLFVLGAREVDHILVSFGQGKYEAGDAVGTFTDTVLSLYDAEPSLRKHTPRSWEVIENWLALMPFANHIPTPPSLLLAMVALAFTWKWYDAVVYLLLSWAGLLRPIECLRLTRSDILLPDDLLSPERAVFIRIRSPKMRRMRARREHAKVTDAFIVEVLECMLAGVPADALLFPYSAGQVRKWHDSLVKFFGVSVVDGQGVTPASHRGGGATALFNQTTDLELTRWRGRWSSSSRTLEIYIQEVGAASVIPSLSAQQRSRIALFASSARSLAATAMAELRARA